MRRVRDLVADVGNPGVLHATAWIEVIRRDTEDAVTRETIEISVGRLAPFLAILADEIPEFHRQLDLLGWVRLDVRAVKPFLNPTILGTSVPVAKVPVIAGFGAGYFPIPTNNG